jgi:hypothetical protein
VSAPGEIKVIQIEQQDLRLGRQVVHDPRSRNFAFQATEPPRRDIQLRVYGPKLRPNQEIGCCTGVDAAVKRNTVGNRVAGQVLTMKDAIRIYSRATSLDPWPGSYPPHDTGSSGLAACKASQEFGLISQYEWIFSGVDGVYAALAAGHSVGVGTWWLRKMWTVDPQTGLVEVGGPRDGGHQWTITGYRKRYDAFHGECWWGDDWGIKGRFLIRRNDLANLLADDGDAHITYVRTI